MSWSGWVDVWSYGKDALKVVGGSAFTLAFTQLRDRKKKKALKALILERVAFYKQLEVAIKTADVAGKVLAEAGMLNVAETLTAAYRALGDEAESLRWGVIAKDLVTFAKHEADQRAKQLQQEQQAHAHLATVKNQYTYHLNRSQAFAVSMSDRKYSLEKAKETASQVAAMYRELEEEGQALDWDEVAKAIEASSPPLPRNREQVADLNCNSPICTKKGGDATKKVPLRTGIPLDQLTAARQELGTECQECGVQHRSIQEVRYPKG